MLGRSYDDQNCSAARALEVVGERWSLLILRDALFRGMTRFTEFQRSLGVAPNILTARLQGFLQAGLMEIDPAANSEQPRYRLTQQGRDFAPVIVALTNWGDQWAAPEGPPIIYRHRECEPGIRQAIFCHDCGQEVEAADLDTNSGPGATPPAHRAVRTAAR